MSGEKFRPEFIEGLVGRTCRENFMLKSTLLLSIAIFLAAAPQPDARDIAQMSGSFIVLDNDAGLWAAVDIRKFERTADDTQSDTAN